MSTPWYQPATLLADSVAHAYACVCGGQGQCAKQNPRTKPHTTFALVRLRAHCAPGGNSTEYSTELLEVPSGEKLVGVRLHANGTRHGAQRGLSSTSKSLVIDLRLRAARKFQCRFETCQAALQCRVPCQGVGARTCGRGEVPCRSPSRWRPAGAASPRTTWPSASALGTRPSQLATRGRGRSAACS